MANVLRPDGGLIHIDGVDVWRDQVMIKSRIGVLPEGLRLFERLSGRELLSYNGQLRGIPRAEVEQRAEGLLKIMDLTEAADKLVIDYSTGMRKKIGLAAALLHNPKVLFLDEPFEGVDSFSQIASSSKRWNASELYAAGGKKVAAFGSATDASNSSRSMGHAAPSSAPLLDPPQSRRQARLVSNCTLYTDVVARSTRGRVLFHGHGSPTSWMRPAADCSRPPGCPRRTATTSAMIESAVS